MNLAYKITNEVNGKVYIGQTTQTLKQRKAEHIARFKSKKRPHKLYLAMEKYGFENFKFSECANALSREHLNDLEITLIKQYDSYRKGYNSTEGGDSLSLRSIETIRNKMKGRKITWYDKILATKRERNSFSRTSAVGASNRNAKSYKVRLPDGKEIVFKGLRAFCKEHGLSHNLLLSTLDGIQTHHKDYVLLSRFND